MPSGNSAETVYGAPAPGTSTSSASTLPAESGPAPAPASPPPSPPPPARKSRILWLVVAVVVAVIVVVAVLALAGVFTPNSTGSTAGSTGTPLDFEKAFGPADSAQSSAPGGPWSIVAAEGWGLLTGSVSVGNFGSQVGVGCTYTPAGGTSTVTVVGTPAGAPPGLVATWIFFSTSASGSGVLLTESTASSATVLGTVSGSGSCTGTFAASGAISATAVVNSTAIGASLNQSGGGSFLASHSVATLLFVLLGPSAATGGAAVWDGSYSTCALLASGGSGVAFSGIYNATTGAALNAAGQHSVTC